MQNYKTVSVVLGAILLVTAASGATYYLAGRPLAVPAERVVVVNHPHTAVHHTAPVACNDGNVAGKAVGGIGGGVLGSLVGKGNGKTAATIGGTLGGAYIGGDTIPLNGVTCR